MVLDDAEVNLYALVQFITIFLIVHVVAELVLYAFLKSEMSIRMVLASFPGLLLYSRILTIWEKF